MGKPYVKNTTIKNIAKRLLTKTMCYSLIEQDITKKDTKMTIKFSKQEAMVRHIKNPWLRQYPKKSKNQHHHTASPSFVIANDEEARPVATFTTTHPVEREQFCKIYLSAVEAFVPLTTAGRKVFVVLFAQLQKNISKDIVQLAFAHVAETNIQMKQSTFTRGIRDLYDNKFIVPIEGLVSTWFINPDYVFNGSRLKIDTTYVIKDADTQQTQSVTDEETEEEYEKAA